MSSRDYGKEFEQDLSDSAPSWVLFERIKDPRINHEAVRAGYNISQPKNLCDFYSYYKGTMWLFEAKTYKDKRIPFKSIIRDVDKYYSGDTVRDKRLWQMVERENSVKGVNSGFILNCRETEETYYVKASLILWCLEQSKANGQRSIKQSFIEKHGILIPQRKKVKHWSYDLLALMDPNF